MKGRGPVVPASQPGAPSSPAFLRTGYPSPVLSRAGRTPPGSLSRCAQPPWHVTAWRWSCAPRTR